MNKKERNVLPRSKSGINWVDLYADSLLSYACSRLNDREIAKDLVQETFLSALEHADSFREESSEKTWLVSILKNKIIDYYRRKGAEKSEPFADIDGSSGLDKYFDATGEWKSSARPVSWSDTGYQILSSKEFPEILRKCLTLLPETYRPVFIARYLNDMNAGEICKLFEVTSSNYWVIMHRSKLRLRECLEKNWFQV